MIGKTISHYRILEKLGEGGMGVVYKAEDTKLKRIVALKFLPVNLIASQEEISRFEQEAEAISALNHPNIETIYDVDEVNGQKFIVLEYIPGGTLKSKLKHLKSEDKSFSLSEVLDYGTQMAEGLAHAHRHQIIHRDVKTENIMLTEEGKVKLTDFGLAKLRGTVLKTKTGSTLGTAAYMSPEQVRGEEVDNRSDIFSFGVVLYELVTSHLPFQGEYEAALSYSILNENPPSIKSLRPDAPQALEKIINRCLEKDKTKRYQRADEIVADLRKVSLSITTQVSIPRRRLKPIWIAVPVVLLALIGLYFLLPLKTDIRDKSVAVLPFQNLSAGGPNSYFAGGLHEELLTQLAKVAALKVISRTSVMSYASTSKPLKQIANELGVRSIVEGSVQVAGERLRVNVQLIDAATDAHLWAERYDRTLDDAFAIQSDVAQQIVAAVGAALSNTEQKGLAEAPTTNAEAYQLYLQGREYWTRPGYLQQNCEIAQELYERALALDPGFALAHAALSEVHGGMYWYRFDPLPARAAHQREEAEAALRLAPDLPQAHEAMGLAHYWGRRDYKRALEEFAIALERLPNDADLWAHIGYVHRRLGHWEEVIAAFEKATQLNPRAANLFYDLGGNTYQGMHRYAEAVRAYDRALSLASDLNVVATWKGWIYVCWQGQLDTLRAILHRLPMDADLGTPGTRAFLQVELLYLERQADNLLRVLLTTQVTVFEEQDWFLPISLYAAWAHQLRGDRSAAHAAFLSALVFLDSALRKLPDDWRVHSARGLALAGLGRRDEALREARWLQQSEVYRADAFQGPQLAEARARILAQAGEVSAALDEIGRLLAEPSWLSVHTLRLDPCWDPIRDHSRFKALLVKYAKR
jgi:serine/threonine protein kinase/Flp pilus assembly protein TadD